MVDEKEVRKFAMGLFEASMTARNDLTKLLIAVSAAILIFSVGLVTFMTSNPNLTESHMQLYPILMWICFLMSLFFGVAHNIAYMNRCAKDGKSYSDLYKVLSPKDIVSHLKSNASISEQLCYQGQIYTFLVGIIALVMILSVFSMSISYTAPNVC